MYSSLKPSHRPKLFRLLFDALEFITTAQPIVIGAEDVAAASCVHANVFDDVNHCMIWVLKDPGVTDLFPPEEPKPLIEWDWAVVPYSDNSVHLIKENHGAGESRYEVQNYISMYLAKDVSI